MIGKIITGKFFRGCLLYCLKDKQQRDEQEYVMKQRAETIMFNKCGGDPKELVQQFNEVRVLNPQLSKPVLHITLSLAPGEHLSRGQLMEITEQCAKELGFANNQFIAVQHKDTRHQHLHIVANRIGFDKRTVNDSNNYRKIATFCRKMELQYGLQKVLNPGSFLSQKERLIPRLDSRKEQLKKDISLCLHKATSYASFVQLMNDKKYVILKGRGIAFIDAQKVKTKGSEVGYSLQTIERILATKNRLYMREMQNRNPVINQGNYLSNNNSEPAKQKAFSPTDQVRIPADELVKQMMKPEPVQGSLPHELLKRKRKKKRQSHHL